MRRKVYLAGPFFNPEQIRLVAMLEGLLAIKGLNVHSPRKHQSPLPFGSMGFRKQTFASDLRAIKRTDIVFAVYNDEDPGTMWEIGFSYSLGKPVILLNTKEKRLNLMIAESLHAYLNSLNQVLRYNFNRLPRIPYTGPII